MGTSTPSAFDSDLLAAIYEVRALVVVVFVLALAVARYVDGLGYDLVADALTVAVAVPLVVVLAVWALHGLLWLRP